jgi:TonB family protein
MLLESAAAPEASGRLGAALRDSRAETRAAAARVVSVASVTPLLQQVSSALQMETSLEAMEELMKAAAALGGSATDPALFAAVARVEGQLSGVLTEILGRRWSAREPAFVWPPTIAPASMGRGTAPAAGAAYVPRGTVEGQGVLTRMASAALREQNAELFEVVLKVSSETGTDVDAGVLRVALKQAGRDDICWYLALAQPRRLSKELLDDATAPNSTDGEISFGCEILGRIAERPLERPRPEKDWTSPLAQEAAKRVPLSQVVLEALTLAERKALSLARGYAEDALDETLDSLKKTPAEEPPPPPRTSGSSLPATVGLLDLAEFPRGFVQDVLVATGCSESHADDVWGGAQIIYKEDGRPLRVLTFPTNEALKSCQHAARLLFKTALAPSSRPARPSENHVVFIRLDPGSLACALPPDSSPQVPSSERQGLRLAGRIKEPKKTKNVAPIYPDSARARRVEGIVVIEATIATSGCVRGAIVVRNSDPSLDMAALRAVADWRYTPTLLDGIPVPVIMTVTVNFRIN